MSLTTRPTTSRRGAISPPSGLPTMVPRGHHPRRRPLARSGLPYHRTMSQPFERDELVEALAAIEPAAAAAARRHPRRPRARPRQPDRRAHRLQRGLRPPGRDRPRDPDRLPADRRPAGRADPPRHRRTRRLRPRPAARQDRHVARLRGRHRLGAGRGRPAADRPARGRRLDPAHRAPACRRRPRSSWPRPGRCSTTAPPASIRSSSRRLCQRAENGYVGVQSGLMDQFAESCGVAGSAVLPRLPLVRVAPGPAARRTSTLVVCHTGSPRRLDALRVQRPAEPVRGGRRRAGPRRTRRSTACATSRRRCSPAAAGRLDPVALRRAGTSSPRTRGSGATVAALEAGDLDAVGAPVRGQPRLAARRLRGQLAGARRHGRDRGRACPAWSPRG